MNIFKSFLFFVFSLFYVGSFCIYATPGQKWIDSNLDAIMEASSQNDSFAQAFLSMVYTHGDKQVHIDFEKAYKLAVLASDSNHWLGHFALGYLYRSEPIGPDLKKVRELYLKCFQNSDGTLIKLAARKDPIAGYVLGEIFTSDLLRPQVLPDLKLAFRHYEISSQLGYGPSSVQLSLFKIHDLIETGKSNSDDKKEGIKILNFAVQKKLPSAHHYLGRAYFEGSSVGQDYKMALIHFQAAADMGYGESQLILADFYSKGLTEAPKMDLAKRYARLALKTNYKKAQEKLDELNSLESSSPPEIAAIPQIDISSNDDSFENEALIPPLPPPPLSVKENDFNSALLPSPYATSESINVSPSSNRASNTKVMQGIKEQNDSSTQEGISNVDLAKNYYWGRGVEKNYKKAYQLFLKSANAGNPESSRYMGLMYLSGKGVTKNIKISIQWFEKAASQGDAMSKDNLQKLKILSVN